MTDQAPAAPEQNGVNGHVDEDVKMSDPDVSILDGTVETPSSSANPIPPTTRVEVPTGALSPAPTPAQAGLHTTTAPHTTTTAAHPAKENIAQHTSSSPARGTTPAAAVAGANSTGGGGLAIPASANYAHGSPTRVYLNARLAPVLLEGMKWVAKHEPEKPLLWMSEYLAQRSKELEK